jgi:hypothetical protein
MKIKLAFVALVVSQHFSIGTASAMPLAPLGQSIVEMCTTPTAAQGG